MLHWWYCHRLGSVTFVCRCSGSPNQCYWRFTCTRGLNRWPYCCFCLPNCCSPASVGAQPTLPFRDCSHTPMFEHSECFYLLFTGRGRWRLTTPIQKCSCSLVSSDSLWPAKSIAACYTWGPSSVSEGDVQLALWACGGPLCAP